jgi:hypothetical protein
MSVGQPTANRTNDSGAAISDTTARRIASEWHGGQSSPLYALTSCGAIDVAAVDREICDCRIYSMADCGDLQSLRNYVHTIGNRGPVAGWPDRTQWS